MEVEVECLQEKTSAGGCTEVGYFERKVKGDSQMNSKHETANIHYHQSHHQGDARNLHVCVRALFASLCLILEQAAQYSQYSQVSKELSFVQTSCLESFLVDIAVISRICLQTTDKFKLSKLV